jgi:LIM domain kinase 1
MDRFDVIRFDDLSGPKGGEWVRIGGGSFGVVFRGEYLGTEVAIKEVLPNNTYDVEKYFERECVLMKEARHPNIVQYIGLTKSPGQDGRIYIVSEFVGPNLRQHIADKNKALDWPMRMSFATDIARAVAYLHARNCMHRDLKGENLLITDNNRIKVCDFGFARIAARNEEEMRRISYCGTDGYMSPEILLGVDFGLPSDVFSLGIIFCEIISRHLVDPSTFKRQMPSFGLDEDEVREMASDGCPTDFINLCLEMTRVDPDDRPDMRHVIRRLRTIEHEVIQREYRKGTMSNIGSVRGSSLTALTGSKSTSTKRPCNSRRLPSFNGQVAVSQSCRDSDVAFEAKHGRNASDSSDEDVEEALRALEQLNVGGTADVSESIRVASTFKAAGHGNPWWGNSTDGSSLTDLPASWLRQEQPHTGPSKDQDDFTPHTSTIKTAMPRHRNAEDEYSTSIVRPSRKLQHPSLASSLSKMTGSTVNIKKSNEAMATAFAAPTSVRARAPLGMMIPNGSISRTIIVRAPKLRLSRSLEMVTRSHNRL